MDITVQQTAGKRCVKIEQNIGTYKQKAFY